MSKISVCLLLSNVDSVVDRLRLILKKSFEINQLRGQMCSIAYKCLGLDFYCKEIIRIWFLSIKIFDNDVPSKIVMVYFKRNNIFK